jgi:uncharacterized membrane protein
MILVVAIIEDPPLINIFVFAELFASIVAITFSAGYNKKEHSTTSKEGFL